MKTFRHMQVLEDYISNPKRCLNCEQELPYEQRSNKFCSRSCAAAYNNKQSVKRIANVRLCKECHAEMRGYNVYCDACIQAGKDRHAITLLELATTDATRRKILIRERGDECEDCGLSEWRGVKLVIQLHHIDGNSDNNLDSNLKLLCPNCHSITPNYASKNRAKNDTSRNRKRRNHYKTGKFVDSQ